MEIKRFGNPVGKKIMMLHGNLMCWRQFEDVIPLLEEEFDVYAVSFDRLRRYRKNDLYYSTGTG